VTELRTRSQRHGSLPGSSLPMLALSGRPGGGRIAGSGPQETGLRETSQAPKGPRPLPPRANPRNPFGVPSILPQRDGLPSGAGVKIGSVTALPALLLSRSHATGGAIIGAVVLGAMSGWYFGVMGGWRARRLDVPDDPVGATPTLTPQGRE